MDTLISITNLSLKHSFFFYYQDNITLLQYYSNLLTPKNQQQILFTVEKAKDGVGLPSTLWLLSQAALDCQRASHQNTEVIPVLMKLLSTTFS